MFVLFLFPAKNFNYLSLVADEALNSPDSSLGDPRSAICLENHLNIIDISRCLAALTE